MNNRVRNKFLVLIISIMIIFPIIINMLMFINLVPVKGDINTWISSLGTFWGAIIGGVISGVLTLVGVNLTIKSSYDSLNLTLKKQQETQEMEVELNTSKDRVKYLYHPAYALVSKFIYKYGAHEFEELTDEDKTEFIQLVDENIIYADTELDTKMMELKWAYKSLDFANANRLYTEIHGLIDYELMKLREKLKLPKLRYYIDEILN